MKSPAYYSWTFLYYISMIDFYQVWHNGDYRNKITSGAKYLELNEHPLKLTTNGMDIQEYKLYFIDDAYFESDNRYVGFASARWSEKFPNSPNIDYILNGFKLSNPNDRSIQALISAQPVAQIRTRCKT